MSATAERPAPSASGTFARTPFAHVLLYMRDRRLSGTLAVLSREAEPTLAGESLLTFEQGALTQVALPSVLEPLGLVLRELGLITDAQLNASLGHLAQGRGLQGEILLAMGACGPDALERGLRAQLRRKALRLFALREADYGYYAGVDLLAEYGGGERYGEDVLPIIWRGVRGAGGETAALDAVLARAAGQALKLRPGAELRAFEFERAEQNAIDLLRVDALTLEQLERAVTDRRLLRALAYVLLITRQVELVPPGAPRVASLSSAARPTPLPPAPAPPSPGAAAASPLRGPTKPPIEVPPSPAASAASAFRAPTRPPIEVPASAATASTFRAPTRPPISQPPPPMSSPLRGNTRPPISPPPPPPDDGAEPPLPYELQALLDKADARYAEMQDETYFQMLNVEPDASDEHIRARFLELAATWHPDRAPDVPAVRDAHQRVFAMLNEAQETLLDEQARKRYLPTLQEGGGTPNAQRKIGQLIEAATDAQKAEVCVRRRDWAEAERLARRALEVMAKDVNVLTVLAAVLLEKSTAGALDEAESLLQLALKQAPQNDRALVLYGTALKRRGLDAKALYQFRRAAEANPKNVEAAREIRLAEMRRRNSVAPSGGVRSPAAAPKTPPGASKAPPARSGEDKSGAGGFFSKLLKK